MIRQRENEIRETLTGGLRFAERRNGQAIQRDLVINTRAEEYANTINERLLKLSETIIESIELPAGVRVEKVVNEINTLGKGFGIIRPNGLLANYQVTGTFIRANSFYSLSSKLQIDSITHWLTENGVMMNKDIKEGSEKYKNKCLRIIKPFLARFDEKNIIDVIFETKTPYQRKVKAIMKRSDFEEGWMKGQVKLHFYDGGGIEKSDYVFLSKISVLN